MDWKRVELMATIGKEGQNWEDAWCFLLEARVVGYREEENAEHSREGMNCKGRAHCLFCLDAAVSRYAGAPSRPPVWNFPDSCLLLSYRFETWCPIFQKASLSTPQSVPLPPLSLSRFSLQFLWLLHPQPPGFLCSAFPWHSTQRCLVSINYVPGRKKACMPPAPWSSLFFSKKRDIALSSLGPTLLDVYLNSCQSHWLQKWGILGEERETKSRNFYSWLGFLLLHTTYWVSCQEAETGRWDEAITCSALRKLTFYSEKQL